MKAILLQILVFFCATAAILALKMMDLPAWINYPLVAMVVVLALVGMALAHYERKSA